MPEPPAMDVEHCPSCGGRIPPEAALCPGCGVCLFEEQPPLPDSPRGAGGETVSARTRPVFAGTPGEVMALQAVLGARGLSTFIEDDSLKVIVPIITGGYCLGNTLLAPAAQADAVAAAIAAAREAARSRGASAPGGPDQAPDWPGNGAGRPEEEIRDLGCRVGWCAVGCLLFAPAGCAIWCFQTAAGIGTAPVALHVLSSSLLCWAFSGYLGLLGVLLALFYFHAVARLGWAPRGSAATLGSTLLCALPSMWLLLSVG